MVVEVAGHPTVSVAGTLLHAMMLQDAIANFRKVLNCGCV